jgi:hypothetical protein
MGEQRTRDQQHHQERSPLKTERGTTGLQQMAWFFTVG